MKIQDILDEELVQPNKLERKYAGKFNYLGSDNNSKKNLDSGSMASVKQDVNDPHMVIKHNLSPFTARDDSYPDFINYLIENKIENIHFPKVYDIHKIYDRYGRYIYKYRLEKLIPLKDASLEEFQNFRYNTFDDDHVFENRVSYMAIDLGIMMRELCNPYSPSSKLAILKSESLKEACIIVRNMTKELKTYSDIYEKNLMWRRGPYGLTLVIIDPI